MNKKEKKDIHVLVVDDDESMCFYLETTLSLMGFTVSSIRTGHDAVEAIKDRAYSVVLLDIMMPGVDGITTLKKIREAHQDIPVIMLSALGQTQMIVKAMKAGASDYITKPFEDDELEIAIENVMKSKRLLEEVEGLRKQLEEEKREHFVFASQKMSEIKDLLDKVADADIPVLIQGESGVGKEVVAKYVHSRSSRKDKPLIKVSCVALPSELLESELFGYEKGAFTDAKVARPGRFGLAHESTIFLDEIGDMLPSLQVKLLQVLQDGVFTRLGAKRETRVDARIIAATNRDLDQSVKEGLFREDLFHRLSVINIKLPTLRERKEDIPILCDHFLAKYNRMYGRNLKGPSKEFMQVCMEYGWPGNVRELENIIRRMVVLRDERAVLSDLSFGGGRGTSSASKDHRNDGATSDRISLKQVTKRTVHEVEKEIILETLKRTRWNRSRAAQELGINYKTLLYKLKRFNI